MNRTLTLLDSGLVGCSTLDRVLQAVIFFADSVAIRASYEISPDSRHLSDQLEWRIDALREQGHIQFWAHEYETDNAGFASNPTDPTSPKRRADLVVDRTSLSENLGEMDDLLRQVREQAYSRRSSAVIALRQGTAEIVALRNNLTSLVISSELNQDGLLTNPGTRNAIESGINMLGAGESFQMAIVRNVMAKLKLGPLSQLTSEQVEQCRAYVADFRKLLDQSLLAVARGMNPTLTPEAIAAELANRYRSIVSEFGKPRVLYEASGEAFWDVLGATLPPSILFKYGLKALRWRKKALDARPYLLLMHLEGSLAKLRAEEVFARNDLQGRSI